MLAVLPPAPGVEVAAAVVAGAAVSPAGTVVVSGATVTTGSLATVNVKLPEPAGCRLVSVITHATTHSPLGAADTSDADNVSWSASTTAEASGMMTPPQVMVRVLSGPSGCTNLSSTTVGDESTVVPAPGVELTRVLSAASAVGAHSDPTNAMARPMATPRVVPILRRGRSQPSAGRTDSRIVFMEVQQR